jgi:hypothetical protein
LPDDVIRKGNLGEGAFTVPGTILDSKGLDTDIDGIDIYALQVDDPFDKDTFIFLFDEVKGKDRTELAEGQQQRPVHINTLYKRKADKMGPVNLGASVDEVPGGRDDWLKRAREEKPAPKNTGKYGDWLIGRFSDLPRGARLTKERAEKLIIGDELTPEERDVLIEALTNREEALAFDWTHCGTIRPEVAPPQEIRTVKHEAWQADNFPVPKALMSKVIEMLQDRLARGTLEYSQGPYRNPWFLVAKKEKGTYRLIVAAMHMNKVTIRDANMPPNVDEFSEEFAGCVVASLLDIFSGYDQAMLALRSRDMTAFQTPIGLLRLTRLPQGGTNSVAQFVRIVQRMLVDIIPKVVMPYVDDLGVKGPRTYYDYEEVVPGVRRFMLEHIQNLDQVLERIERAGATIGPKSQYCMPGLRMVGFVTDADGRRPDTAKVIKILEWNLCESESEVRSFLGVCVYYRLWVKNFGRIAEPLYRLLKKDVPFVWGYEQAVAMERLKTALTEAPALAKIDYSEGAGDIILTVDASLTGWGAVLQQLDARDKTKRHSIRYESGLWSAAERNYDATKRECRGALKALKKMRSYLTGVHFILETDAAVLVDQLRGAASDLPSALLTRWVAWMQLFDFEVRHIPGTKNTAADGLSRRARHPSDDVDDALQEDIDEWVLAQMDPLQINKVDKVRKAVGTASLPSPARQKELPLRGQYSEESQRIARFLTTVKRPPEMKDPKAFYRFKKKALCYTVAGEQLYRRGGKGRPMRLVVDSPEERRKVISSCHDELGHKGRESTYRRVATRFFWDRCYLDCKEYVQSCVCCQKREATRTEEALYPTWASALWEKVGLDVTYMPTDGGKKALVIARDDLSGWPEAKALANATAEEVATFLWEEVVCRHGVFGRLVIDGGPENQGFATAFTKKYGIERVQISAYNSKANGMVERGHRSISEALSRMGGGKRRWRKNLAAVLLAERTSIHRPTGVTPFFLVYGREAILPIDTRYPIWRLLDWHKVRSGEELLALRARQLQLRGDDIEEIILRKRRIREEGKDSFDQSHQIRKEEIKVKDIVLAYHSKRAIDMSSNLKLSFRWLGPYRVKKANTLKGTYTLEEVDGTPLKGTYAGNRLKKFVYKGDTFTPADQEDETDSTMPGTSEESDSWEEDSAGDEELPRATINTRNTTKQSKPTRITVIPPQLTTAEKALYTQFSSEST